MQTHKRTERFTIAINIMFTMWKSISIYFGQLSFCINWIWNSKIEIYPSRPSSNLDGASLSLCMSQEKKISRRERRISTNNLTHHYDKCPAINKSTAKRRQKEQSKYLTLLWHSLKSSRGFLLLLPPSQQRNQIPLRSAHPRCCCFSSFTTFVS